MMNPFISDVEKISVVMAYINHRKGVKVNIRKPRDLREALQLDDAYNYAVRWFKDNGGGVKLI